LPSASRAHARHRNRDEKTSFAPGGRSRHLVATDSAFSGSRGRTSQLPRGTGAPV